MKCKKCGKEFEEGIFCPNCGERVEEGNRDIEEQNLVNPAPKKQKVKKKKTIGGCLLSIVKIIVVTNVLLFVIGVVFGDEGEETVPQSENTQQVEHEKNQEDEKSKRIEEAKKLEEEQQRLIEEQERVKEEAKEQLAAQVTGDFKTDAENGVLFVDGSKIVDAEGNPIEAYSSYTVNENGYVSTEFYVVEGIFVDGNRLTYTQPKEVEDNTIKVTAEEAIRYHDDYEGQRIQMYGTVVYLEQVPYLYVNGKDFIRLTNYYVVDGHNDSSPAELLNNDYVKVYGTFHYNTGTWYDIYNLHTMDECVITITDVISSLFDD